MEPRLQLLSLCCHCSWAFAITTLCLKNAPSLTCYNLDIHDPITIIFGRSVTEKVRNQRCFVSHLIYSASAFRCEIGNTEDSSLVHCACNTVQFRLRSRLRLSWNMPASSPEMNALITRFRESYSSVSIYESWVKKIEEIKQLLEFRHCTNTASEWKKCNLRVSPFCKVVQKQKLFEVA